MQIPVELLSTQNSLAWLGLNHTYSEMHAGTSRASSSGATIPQWSTLLPGSHHNRMLKLLCTSICMSQGRRMFCIARLTRKLIDDPPPRIWAHGTTAFLPASHLLGRDS